MITIRAPESIFQTEVPVQGGTCRGRWHFSFDRYHDPAWVRFGPLRVFNDDTLTPGAVWPLHPHRDIEVVTYCAAGEFRHADERGEGGVLKEGWVQHTTVGSGMWHSEINARADAPMRFIQMWFLPSTFGLPPSVEQKPVAREERSNRILPLVSPEHGDALYINQDARVYSCHLEAGRSVDHRVDRGRGAYLYVLTGGPVRLSGDPIPALGAAVAVNEDALRLVSEADAELLLVDVPVA